MKSIPKVTFGRIEGCVGPTPNGKTRTAGVAHPGFDSPAGHTSPAQLFRARLLVLDGEPAQGAFRPGYAVWADRANGEPDFLSLQLGIGRVLDCQRKGIGIDEIPQEESGDSRIGKE